jgi:hypothetical protein
MMRILNHTLVAACAAILCISALSAQDKKSPAELITAARLENHMEFLASPLLKGRGNGDPGLRIAQDYIVSQVKLLGLKPVNTSGYYQPYSLIKSSLDPEKTLIRITRGSNEPVTVSPSLFQIFPTGPSDFSVEGEVVFAGYGLRQDKYGYNDFADMKADGKILLIMDGAPTSEDGKKYLFGGVDWSTSMSIEAKLLALLTSRAKAVIIVTDPKSGFTSLDEKLPGMAWQFQVSYSLKGSKPLPAQFPMAPKILSVDRSLADELLAGTGYTLEGLQNKIDRELKPFTFVIPGVQVKITETVKKQEIVLNNVAACIEGSDPVLRDEYIIFSGHIDHLGSSGNIVNSGADDNASGCSALLTMAQAFQGLDKKPLRSVLFLWVSGEEIGLFGSKFYIDNPLVPLQKTVCDLNLDMIGRIKGVADSLKEKPVADPERVFVITDFQSKDLLSIAGKVDSSTVLDFDYSLSGRNHPLQLFTRSDHYNFARKDIPVFFFTTGEHSDYHTPGDVLDKISFSNMELITKAMFRIGYDVANRKARITVDNPFSKW